MRFLTTKTLRVVWKSRRGLFEGPGRVFRALSAVIESGVVYTLLWVGRHANADIGVVLTSPKIWYLVASNDAIVAWEATAWDDYYLTPLTASI